MHCGPVRQVLARYETKYGSSQYITGMRQTLDLLVSWGYDDPLSYEDHSPLLVNKHAIVDVIRRALEARPIRALHKRTLYGNVMGLGGVRVSDCKVSKVDQEPTDRPFLSVSDESWQFGLAGKYVRERFPDPSEYEEDE